MCTLIKIKSKQLYITVTVRDRVHYVFNNNTILSHMIAKMIDSDASIKKTVFFYIFHEITA